jgi:hypothetical protein
VEFKMARTFRFRGYQEGFGMFDTVFAGLLTTVGGAVTEVFNIRGVHIGDIPIVTMNTFGTGSVTVSTAIAGKNRLTVVFSGNPVANHVINVLVTRRRRATPATTRHP